MKVVYLIGDATCPIGDGKKIIPHVCNDRGGWGAGFVLALSNKWKEPEMAYLRESTYVLGSTTIVEVEPNISVANMIAQHNTYNKFSKKTDLPPIRYDALRSCLTAVNYVAMKTGATLHCPRFGTGLAGGTWEEVLKIIEEVVTVDVYIYDLPERGVIFRRVN